MSLPNPTVLEPALVMNLERNGPANMITEMDAALMEGRPVNTTLLRLQAQLFDRFVAKLEEGRKLLWHEHLAEEKAKGFFK